MTTPLHQAVIANNLHLVKELIDTGAIDINIKDYQLRTPLHVASANERYLDIVKFLINSGANLDARNNIGSTPLLIACQYGNIQIVNLLIVAGADVEIKDFYSNKPLHIATYYGHLNIVDALITTGADVNVKDKSEETPLDIALRHQHSEIVQLLKEAADYQNPIKEPDIY